MNDECSNDRRLSKQWLLYNVAMHSERDERDRRPTREALLAIAGQQGRGRLKVFLGAAPGVGKTYAMLQAAQQRKREGIHIVVGVVETHGRAETEVLLEGLEIVPRKKVDYRGHVLEEMDLDEVLRRKPQLVLVDELAHTNAVGSRHPKRYQDVEELISAGIDVDTTVNVQHLESLNDAVAQITGIRVRETLPDRLIEQADEVQLIDLPPEELIQRLKEGKVYIPSQAARAVENYFRLGNLSALRELALRRTAERVDDQMQDWMRAQAVSGPWPTTDRIMVCVSPSPLSPRLVRTAKRRADRRNAPWMAVYVETPRHQNLSDAERDQVARTLRLAEQLGGEAVSVTGHHPAEDLIRYAHKCNATEIIIGKSLRRWWNRLRHGSIVNDLISRSGEIDILVITSEERPRAAARGSKLCRPLLSPGVYIGPTVAVVVVALAAKLLGHFLPVPNLTMIFLLGVLLSAVRFGLWPSLYASALSALVYNFFFTSPLYTFRIVRPGEMLSFIVYFVVAVITSNLTARIREQAEAARRREDRTAALLEMSRAVAGAASLDAVALAVCTRVNQIVGTRVMLLVPRGERLEQQAEYPPGIRLADTEFSAAVWASERRLPAGHGTDTLPAITWLFLPLLAAQHAVGVLGVQFENKEETLPPAGRRLLEGLANHAAIALERTRLADEMERNKVFTETEKLRSALLSSISHDLRTPLASILGSVTSMLQYEQDYTPEARRELLSTIQEETERLNRFVGNLLDITQLEAGRLIPNRSWMEIEDVLGSSLAQVHGLLRSHDLITEIASGLPLLRLDFVLIQQVLVNLLDNAAKYSTPSSKITVRARSANEHVRLEIVDEGIGIPEEEREKVFDKFYRVMAGDRRVAGTGLGLSICRGIVEGHGGMIRALSGANGQGTTMLVELPIEPQPELPGQD
jgi:two-component system sensor histidine kinase KdpD